jgi:glycosyltransferase involved in cell wall biosynthesis
VKINKTLNHKKRKPYFSIITVVKNDENNIIKTIASVNSQSFKNFEYIIIDGSSVDNTLKNIKKREKNFDILISEKDKGIYYAMNKAAKIASGKIIVYVNCGDKLTKNALRIIQKKFKVSKNLDFVFGTVRRHYTKNTILKYGVNIKRLNYNFDFATTHSTGFFIKRKIFKKLKYFNTRYKYSADYDLYYRLIIKNKSCGSSTKKNELIGIMKAGGYSSKISFFEHLKEEMRIRYDNGQNLLLIMLIFFNALIKHIIKAF